MLVAAKVEFALAARAAFSAMTAEATDTDALIKAPYRRCPIAERDNTAYDLMARNTGLVATRIDARDVVDIGAAHSASFDGNQHIIWAGHWNRTLNKLQMSRSLDHHGTVGFLHPVCPHGQARVPNLAGWQSNVRVRSRRSPQSAAARTTATRPSTIQKATTVHRRGTSRPSSCQRLRSH